MTSAEPKTTKPANSILRAVSLLLLSSRAKGVFVTGPAGHCCLVSVVVTYGLSLPCILLTQY